MSTNTFFTYCFGCRVNQAEKDELDRQMVARGYIQTEDNPNLYILNSCAVTQKAEREARQLVHRLKRENPQSHIVVTGCAATNWLKKGEKLSDVDLLIDNQNKEFVAEIIDRRL
ncbi:hypothetical protein HGB07_06720, partial [Candidatus Roizmanbacteria bacterium]|nr:hypothetical protein [Candidatus Roizmanbacteria bacterium]